jgi:hypothetical protein
MQITEIQSDFNLQYRSLPRSPGVHVSSVIQDVARRMGFLKRDDEEELDWTLARYRMMHGEDIARVYPTVFYRVMMGLAFEEWLGPQLDINYHGIGELELDGIAGTPDGISFDPDTGAGVLHELKLTWKSSRSDRDTPQDRLTHEFMWLAQTKAYCAQACAMGLDVTEAHLHVYWVNGNYRGSGPEYRRYRLQFTPKEIEANWRLIRTASRTLANTKD